MRMLFSSDPSLGYVVAWGRWQGRRGMLESSLELKGYLLSARNGAVALNYSLKSHM